MKQLFHFFAPCPRGLEGVLAQELTDLKAENVLPTDGGVGFSGSLQTMMLANLHSRIASRILWKLAEKPYRSEEDIYRLARDLEWADLFAVEIATTSRNEASNVRKALAAGFSLVAAGAPGGSLRSRSWSMASHWSLK